MALRYANFDRILEVGRIVMDVNAKTTRGDVKGVLSGVGCGGRKSFRNVTSYMPRKRWLS